MTITKTDEEIVSAKRFELGNRATAQQRKAADPACSVWVNASAGTGKTKVLSDRVLRLLLAGVNAGKLLCLTYTKAAAVEMSTRVYKKLSKWAVADEDNLEKELISLYGSLPDSPKLAQKLKEKARRLFAVLLDTPGGIKIQTLHSFCQEILKRFPLEAGISPHAELMDDHRANEAIEEIKAKLINEINHNPDSQAAQSMLFLTSHVSESSFPTIVTEILKSRSKIDRLFQKYKNVNNLLSAQAQKLEVNPNLTLIDITRSFFKEMDRDNLQILLNAYLDSGSSFQKRSAFLQTILEQEDPTDFETYQKAFIGTNGFYAKAACVDITRKNPLIEEIYTSECQRIEEFIDKQKSYNVYASTHAVSCLADSLISSYNHYKTVHSLMDYGDMILVTKHLLENKEAARWVLYKLDGGIDNILIDEAQDTSPDQWSIIRAISEEFFTDESNHRTIFAVGDRKQSIYSFQGADPDKFDEMKDYFSHQTPNFNQINLEVSFRSTPAVLDSVNQLFKVPEINHGVASQGEKIIHIPFRYGEAGKVELWEMIEPEKEENVIEWQPPVEQENAPTTSSRMAKKLAEKIHSMVTNKEILTSQNRPLRYGDFLILVKGRDAFCEEFIRECKKVGINIAGMDRIKLLEQIAIQDLVSLGKFLLLPDDDLSLAEVLKSPLFGFEDDDLFNICYQRKGSLWNSLEQCSKYQSVTQTLKKLFKMVDYVRPFELYSYVMGPLNGYKKFAERMGGEAEDGLDEFINLTLNFEQSHIATMQRFIEWIEGDDVEIKRETDGASLDLLRIMTVHGSKGLQAPIVILPDTAKVPPLSRSAGLLWDNDGIFVYPTCADNYDKTCERIKNYQNEKALEEYRRLLYVAVTRAEDRMIFCGYRKSRKPNENCWYNLFANQFSKISVLDEESKTMNFSSPQLFTPKEEEKKETEIQYFKPEEWMITKAPNEDPLAKPYTPSKPEEEEPAVLSPLCSDNNMRLFKRGTLIHRLLQFLPNVDTSKRNSSACEFILKSYPKTPTTEIEQIMYEINSLLDNQEFGSVFGPNSKAEVPIMGMVDNKIISGQIDRLIVEENRVVIVDFKTNRPAAADTASIPEIYRQQLKAYRQLLKKIYPDKEVISLILWTNTAKLMPVE